MFNANNRLSFLRDKFNVFDVLLIDNIISEIKTLGYEYIIHKDGDDVLCVVYSVISGKREKTHIKVSNIVFDRIISTDPTTTKSYVQWLLELFCKYMRNDIEMGLRFIREDLLQASNYIGLFESNKYKDRFKSMCSSSYILRSMKDPTNINQYVSLSQLFNAIDPFIIREPSNMERLINRFVEMGEAEIPVSDMNYMVYIPLSRAASEIFGDFTNWCTSKVGNGMFKSYTTNNKRPDGLNSKLYVIINRGFFDGKSNELYQLHFETKQVRDRTNSYNSDIGNLVLIKSESLRAYFYDELFNLTTSLKNNNKGNLDNNLYLDYMISFGYYEILFDLLDETMPSIKFMGKYRITDLPDLSRFKNLDTLVITNSSLCNLGLSLSKNLNLEILSLTNNHVKELPDYIGNLKKLKFISIVGNHNIHIPDTIKYLDTSMGGSLYRISTDISDENEILRLKSLLPNVIIT